MALWPQRPPRGDGLGSGKAVCTLSLAAHLWINQARVDTVWDSGATRNSIDKDFLKALLLDSRTACAVNEIIDIEPRECTGLLRSSTLTIRQVAVITVTAKESSCGRQEVFEAGFCVVPDSTEDLLIGKPTLDRLGFVSDKHSIELRDLGIRMATLLPEELAANESKDTVLRLADNEVLHDSLTGSAVRTVELVAPRGVKSGKG